MKSNLHKVLALLLSLPLVWQAITGGLTLLFLAGCGAEKEGKQVITIRWLTDPNPIRETEISMFEKENPGIKIKPDWIGDEGVQVQKILTQIAGGDPPDIMISGLTYFHEFAKKGVFEELTPYCQKYNVPLDDYWPALAPYIYHEGKIFGIPFGCTPTVLFYNKKLFDEAGLSYPDSDWDWDGVVDSAKRLTRFNPVTKRIEQFGLVITFPYDLIWQNGGMMYSADGTRCVINSSEAKEALQFWHDLFFEYKVMPTPSQAENLAAVAKGSTTAMGIFAAGKIGMFASGRFVSIFCRQNKELEWGISPIPHGKYRVNRLGAGNYCIPRDSKHKEEAFRFLYFLACDEKHQLLEASYGDAVPVRMSVARREEFLFNPDYPEEKNNHIYMEELKYSKRDEVSPYAPYLEVEAVWQREIDLMLVQKQTPQETLDKIAQQVNSLIEKNLR